MIANTLFHFTQELETIFKILVSNHLRAAYNIESIEDFYPNQKFLAIPMVCFCDIPLKYISTVHTQRYGSYGIGFEKNWGINNSVNPIYYRQSSSMAVDSYQQIINSVVSNSITLSRMANSVLYQKNSTISSLLNANEVIKSNALKLAFHMKPYGVDKLNYIDREWRWVANAQSSFSEDDSATILNEMNKNYFKNPDTLPFDQNDVKYIIIKSKEEQSIMINMIDSMNIDQNIKYKLVQKIIDLESINQDM